jgi:PAS domain S-box-containing protein
MDSLVVVAVLLAGLIGSAMVYRALHEGDVLRLQEVRSTAAQSVLDSFALDLTRMTEAIHNSGLLIESHPQLHRAQFNAFAARMGTTLPFLTFLEWQPAVQSKDVPALEAFAKKEGLAGYRVVQPQGDGWVPVRGRDEYVPVLYGWPQGSAALGVDMGFYPERMESKLRARSTGRPVASEVFPIIQSGLVAKESNAFAISTAVYQSAPRSGAGQGLTGYLAAVIQIPLLMEEARARADAGRLDLLLYDRSNGARRLIFSHIGDDSDLDPKASARYSIGAADHVITVDVATRSWEVVLHPRPAFFAALPQSLAQPLLVTGVLTTLLLAFAVARLQQSQRSSVRAHRAERQSREALAVEQQRLQNILEGTDVGTWEFNFVTSTLNVNERWAGIGGYTLAELPPEQRIRWQEFCHPEDLPRIREALRSHLAGETDHYEIEYRIRHKNGHWIWVSARARVLRHTADGKPELIVGTNLEVTARKLAEHRIIELNETLEHRVQERTSQLKAALQSLHRSQEELSRSEARATLGTLVASVSHELSTPMGNSTMTASTLQAQARSFQKLLDSGTLRRSDLTEFVARVHEGNALTLRNLERAADLLKNFRQVAADQASEQRRSFDLHQVVQEVLDTLAPSLRPKPHQIRLDIPDGIRMDSYPGPLGQVVINLVNNAYLHAFEGMAQGTFTIQGQPTADGIVLTFADNGCGIAPETLKKMFEPFFSTRIGSGGTGLGMPIVENLVTKTLGGTLTVESTPGKGTTFQITLPLVAPQGKQE